VRSDKLDYGVTGIQYVKTVYMVVFCITSPPLDTVLEDFCNRLGFRGLHLFSLNSQNHKIFKRDCSLSCRCVTHWRQRRWRQWRNSCFM